MTTVYATRDSKQFDDLACQESMTLVDLLVAVGVLAVIAVMGWRGLNSIARTRDYRFIRAGQWR